MSLPLRLQRSDSEEVHASSKARFPFKGTLREHVHSFIRLQDGVAHNNDEYFQLWNDNNSTSNSNLCGKIIIYITSLQLKVYGSVVAG